MDALAPWQIPDGVRNPSGWPHNLVDSSAIEDVTAELRDVGGDLEQPKGLAVSFGCIGMVVVAVITARPGGQP